MIEFVIEPQASLEIEDAAMWYETKRSGLGVEFVLETDIAIQRIRENPKLYIHVYSGIRRALLHRFPYALYFIANNQKMRIMALLHQTLSGETVDFRLL